MKHGPKHDPAPRVVIPFPPGLSYHVAEDSPVPHLTEKQLVVASWMAEGKQDSEIAGILKIGIETVKTHVSKILEETGVENRSAFIAWAWRNRMAAELEQRARSSKGVKYS